MKTPIARARAAVEVASNFVTATRPALEAARGVAEADGIVEARKHFESATALLAARLVNHAATLLDDVSAEAERSKVVRHGETIVKLRGELQYAAEIVRARAKRC